MQYTTNLNLKKPEPTDPVKVEDLNDNFDIIDAEITDVFSEEHAATPSRLGLVKPDGETTEVDENGVLTVLGLPSAASKLAEAYAYAKMLGDITGPRYVYFSTDFSTDFQETYDFPVVYQSQNNHTEYVYSDGWDYVMEEYSFEAGKLYFFRPVGEEGMHLPFEVHSVDDIETYVHFLN